MCRKYIFVLLTFTSVFTFAEDSKFYAGLKGGYSSFSGIAWEQIGSGTWEVDDSAGFGLLAGYNLLDELAIEIDIMHFSSKTKDNPAALCDLVNGQSVCTSPRLDYSSNTYSIYAAYKTQGDIFFKGRLGYAYQQHEFSTSKGSYGLPEPSESSLSGSIGVGANYKKMTFEGSYTYVTDEVGYSSLGILYNF
ncbi:MAG: porin family protein [Pseudomonadales bacterium]|nr:porin family protein [Pseudomonadales bacterium]